MILAEQELARAIGRLEQAIETQDAEVAGIKERTGRVEERVNHLSRLAGPIKTDLAGLRIEATARSGQADDHGKRIAALEAPIEKALKDGQARRDRMRARIKQVGALIGGAFVIIEWVAKPIAGLIAEAWWRGVPPGH